MTDDKCCDGVEAAQEMISKHVKKGEWGIIGRHATETAPPVTYTVGLHHKGLPDLIVVGLNYKVAFTVLNDAAQQLIDNGGAFPAGTALEKLASMPLVVIDTFQEKKREYAIQAYNHYQHWNFVLQQLVMPDAQGLLPWQDGFDERMKRVQPLLGPRPALH